MTRRKLAKIIRKVYRAEKEALDYTIKKQEGDRRRFRDEYYFNSGRDFAIYGLACELGVELYDKDLKLIGEEA